MSFKPETNNPDLETIGRYLDALGSWLLPVSETLKTFGNELVQEATGQTEQEGDK